MSANNLMYIEETPKGFIVTERDADNLENIYTPPKIYKDLKTAVKKAQQEETEYGLFFVLR